MPEYIHFEGRTGRVTRHHYSLRPSDAVLFYGGPFSNFVGGPWALRDWDGQRYLNGLGTRLGLDPKPLARETMMATYDTLEHWLQANKASTRSDHDYIRTRSGPGVAKKCGQKWAMDRRGVVIRPDWEDVKYDILLIGLRVKFSTRRFGEVLIGTGNRLIAEDSPTDYIWGIRDEHGGYTGTNLLGKGLMEIRDELLALDIMPWEEDEMESAS